MSWFTNLTEDLGSGASSVGGGVGDLLGGFLSPLTQGANNLLGSTTQTSTQTIKPDESAKSSSKTATIIVAVLGVTVLIVVSIIIFKSAKTA